MEPLLIDPDAREAMNKLVDEREAAQAKLDLADTDFEVDHAIYQLQAIDMRIRALLQRYRGDPYHPGGEIDE